MKLIYACDDYGHGPMTYKLKMNILTYAHVEEIIIVVSRVMKVEILNDGASGILHICMNLK